MFGIDLRKLLLGALSAGLLPLSCLASGCSVTSDGVKFKGGLGTLATPVVTWHVNVGDIDAAIEAPGLAEVPK